MSGEITSIADITEEKIKKMNMTELLSDDTFADIIDTENMYGAVEAVRKELLCVSRAEELGCKTQFVKLLRAFKKDYKSINTAIKQTTAASNKIPIDNLDYEWFAHYMIEKYNYCIIEKTLYKGTGVVYTVVTDSIIENDMMDCLFNSTIKIRKEATKYIQKYAPVKVATEPRYILFKNGVYDLETKSFTEQDEDMVFFNEIPVNYVPYAPKQDIIDKFFNDLACGDDEVKTLLIQMIGYCFMRDNRLGKFFMLQGKGGNGKSTLFALMSKLLGEDNISELSLGDINDKYGLSVVQNKLVNLGDDIENIYIDRCSQLKKLVTGETVTVEEKFQAKKYFKCFTKLIFTGNELPKMADKTDGLKRRLIVVPMLADFKKAKVVDFGMANKITSPKAMEYLVALAVEQLHVVLANKSFINSKAAEQATETYNEENNPVIGFYKEHMNHFTYAEGKRLPAKYLFKLWQDYCFNNNVQNKRPLSTFINDLLDVVEPELGKLKKFRGRVNKEEADRFKNMLNYRNNETFVENIYFTDELEQQINLDESNDYIRHMGFYNTESTGNGQ